MSTATLPPFLDQRLIDTEPPAGYTVDWSCGAWRSLPWPDKLELIPPTLGWAAIEWAEENLIHHLTGKPWRYTKAQKRFLVLWYGVDNDGEWVYRRGVVRRAKGVGKDPFGATMLHVEAHAPIVFEGFDPQTRQPVGYARKSALVQIAANSEEQGKDVLHVANQMVSKRLKIATGFVGGKTQSATKTGVRYQVLTSSEASAEGDPSDFILINENHHATEANGGHRMGGVVRRNLAKSPGGVARSVELTNAFEQGEDSEAERMFTSWQAQVMGKTRERDILYDSCEAPAYLSLHSEEDVHAGVIAAYADAPWINIKRIKADIDDTQTTAAEAIRFYFNQSGDNESHWCSPRAFDARRRDIVVKEKTAIAMFLDCSKNDDATALGACTIDGRHSFHLGGWQKPHGDRGRGWLAPREQVEAAVRLAFQQYHVAWFGIDPSPVKDDDTEALYWRPMIERLHVDFRSRLSLWATPGKHSVEFDMRMSSPGGPERNRLFTEQSMLCVQEIEGQIEPETGAVLAMPTLTHDGDPFLVSHVHNARRRSNKWGYSLSKVTRDSGKKVDAAVTMVGARLGAALVVQSGKLKKPGSLVAHSW